MLETVDTTRRMLTGTTDDWEEDDDEPPRIVADYVPTPKRSRFTRRIKVTEETDEDEHSSSRERMKASCLAILLSKNDPREPKSPKRHKSRSRERSKNRIRVTEETDEDSHPSRSRSREGEAFDTMSKASTETTDDEEEEMDEQHKRAVSHIPTPKRPRLTRRIRVTEETDEDSHSSSA